MVVQQPHKLCCEGSTPSLATMDKFEDRQDFDDEPYEGISSVQHNGTVFLCDENGSPRAMMDPKEYEALKKFRSSK